MNRPAFKPQPIHWYLLIGAILFGVVLFFVLRMTGY